MENVAQIEVQEFQSGIICRGLWTVSALCAIDLDNFTVNHLMSSTVYIDGQAIQQLDTSGAWMLVKLIEKLRQQNKGVSLVGFSQEYEALLQTVDESGEYWQSIPKAERQLSFVQSIGQHCYKQYQQGKVFLAFIGESVIRLSAAIKQPSTLSWVSIWSTLESAGYQALPIIALLSFLIGVVISYQMGQQLRDYGANIYIVNVTGKAILREFGPLITAIIAAGRTASAFCAQIGTMKVNEEIDALTTLGISPIERLVLPKIIALLVAMPLLVVWANVFGLLGSMLMANSHLDISYLEYTKRFADVISLKTYFLGLVKAPFFALIIALVGCFQGFQVAQSAASVGHQTTKSVVQAIFLIIVTDAIFSVLFSWRGL